MNFIINNSNKNVCCLLHLSSLRRSLATKKPVTNPYETLGITRHAKQKDIKNAYYRLSKQYHPDVNQSKEAAIRFQDITNAYEQIGNEESRSRFDRDMTARVVSGGGMRRTASMMAATREPKRESVESGDDYTEFFRERQKQQNQGGKSEFFNAKKLSAMEAWKLDQEKLNNKKNSEEKFEFTAEAMNSENLNSSKPPPVQRVQLFMEHETPARVRSGMKSNDNQMESFGIVLLLAFVVFYSASKLAPDLTYKPQHYEVALKKFANSEKK